MKEKPRKKLYITAVDLLFVPCAEIWLSHISQTFSKHANLANPEMYPPKITDHRIH